MLGRLIRQLVAGRPRRDDGAEASGRAADDALARLRSGDLAGAELAARRALQHDAGDPLAHFVLAATARESGRLDEAIVLYRQGLARGARSPQLLHGLGTALIERGDFDDAATRLQQALELAPRLASARESLSRALFNARRFAAAETVERELLAHEPDAIRLHLRLAHALLAQGKLAGGWAEYDWRLRQPGFSWGVRGLPRWDGTDPAGRTILVVSEQGLGDAILFARFVPDLARRGARVRFLCRPQLERLFRSSFEAEAIRVTADASEDAAGIHAHVHLLSLPRALGVAAPEPRSGYLRVDPTVARPWRERVAACAGLKVGLAWAGNAQRSGDETRSLPHELVAPLREAAPRVTWFNLQAGLEGNAARPFPMVDWIDEVRDYADTAALIDALDLVISVDTSVAHAAAALGKPLWLLAPHNVCWRWEIAGVESPWYPGVRMFRAQRPNAWAPVIEDLRLALRASAPSPRR
jgi:tetratricopeptide (TPR) repeat protein